MTESPIIPGTYGEPIPVWAKRSLARLPPGLRSEVELTKKGGRRAGRRVVWFAHFLETLDHTEAALAAGYDREKAANIGREMKREFALLIDRALPYVRAQLFPLAIKRQREVLERAYQPDAKVKKTRFLKGGGTETWEEADPNFAGPMAAQTVLKAAEQVLKYDHRAPDNMRDRDWKKPLDDLVAEMGIDAVRRLSMVKARPDFRAYLDDTYGALKEVEGPVAAAEADSVYGGGE